MSARVPRGLYTARVCFLREGQCRIPFKSTEYFHCYLQCSRYVPSEPPNQNHMVRNGLPLHVDGEQQQLLFLSSQLLTNKLCDYFKTSLRCFKSSAVKSTSQIELRTRHLTVTRGGSRASKKVGIWHDPFRSANGCNVHFHESCVALPSNRTEKLDNLLYPWLKGSIWFHDF